MAAAIPTRGPELFVVDVAFVTVAIIANALRCYVRLRMVKAFGLDDYLMTLATVFFIGYSTSSIIGVKYGTGRHHRDLPTEGVYAARHCWWFCYLFYCCATILSKVSIGCFLLRIAVRKFHTYIIYTAMLLSVVAGGTFFFVTLFQCNPISFFWNKSQTGTCVNSDVIVGLGYLYSVFAIITDFTFALLPAFLVAGLQLKRRTKIALIPLLAMGCIASLAVVARLPFMPRLKSEDFLWDTVDVAIWSTVEQGLAITAGSLATLRPLFSLVLYKLGLASASTAHRRSPSSSQILGSRRKASRSDMDIYNLTAVAEEGKSKTEVGGSPPDMPKSPNWYHSRFDKVRRASMPAKKKKEKGGTGGDDGSEKSLRDSESASLREEGAMQIMVSRSFVVTDAERSSYVKEGPR
ncbi:hypothetical protein K458DRAFT_381627 [Lentithecium fluviatile CBS 122367]|uniref:Rhodopsin domain-containing protein n=1 Tax=Lentithecium fluviatile CBS 122367 TaxID=1168545 RepID=A0A6G1JNG2_9PLEO|nr:hypothetical protein K458DRAFT_381627 [Lentithecium fluviatile CBS 122367]